MSLYARFPDLYREIFPARPVVVDLLADLLGPPPASLLDVGCGPGDLAGLLAGRGYDVLGIDVEEDMVVAARQRHRGARFRVLDLRRLADLRPGTGPLTGACCLGNVLPHVPPADLPPALASLRRLLAPDGFWLLQTVNWDALAGRQEYVFPDKPLPNGGVCRRRYERRPDGSMAFRLEVLDGARETGHVGEEILYPVGTHDLDALHRKAGFRLAWRWGDFAGASFAPACPGGCVSLYRRR